MMLYATLHVTSKQTQLLKKDRMEEKANDIILYSSLLQVGTCINIDIGSYVSIIIAVYYNYFLIIILNYVCMPHMLE